MTNDPKVNAVLSPSALVLFCVNSYFDECL